MNHAHRSVPIWLLAIGVVVPLSPKAEPPEDEWRWTPGLTLALNGVAETNLFWDLPDGAAPSAGYDGSRQWIEGFITPSIAFSGPLSRGWRLDGRASVLASGTWGSDAFAAGDTARVDMEEAWVAVERGGEGSDPRVRLSLGAQPLRLAEGMLVSNGGSNGFERGALKLGPRKAWRDSALLTFGRNDLTVQGLILSPNEQDSNRTGARLRGLDLAWKASPEWALGGTWIDVTASRSPYPQAAPGGQGPPVFLDGARAGLRALHGWATWERTLDAGGRRLFARIDGARQGHEGIDLDAWAGRIRGGWGWQTSLGRWTAMAAWQAFSGDDPNTSKLERFDPLYYDGSPSAWATGSKSAMVFINSNVSSTNLSLALQQASGRALTLRYARVTAMELRSPLQFGQATRFDDAEGAGTVVAGVTDRHLSDDVFLEFNQPLSRQAFLSAGVSVSAPGRGIRQVFPSSDPYWSGAYVTFFYVR